MNATRGPCEPLRARNSAVGVSLLKVLIVVVVLGILAPVVVVALGSLEHCRGRCLKTDAATVDAAISAYNVQNAGGAVLTEAALISGPTTYSKSFPLQSELCDHDRWRCRY